jgi:hypothetical protein
MTNKKSLLFPGTLTLLVVCTSLLFSSCSRDRIERDLNTYESPNAYLDSKKQEEQIFVIDSAGEGPIIGNQGTTIWGSIDCLQLPGGGAVTYPFLVKLVELYTPKDMIYYRMPTVSAGAPLETAGEIRLRAEKDGQELSLIQPCAFQVSMPNAGALANYMSVYYGIENGSTVDWTTNLATWGITQNQNPIFTVDTIGYNAFIEKLGWINADRAVANSGTCSITFDSEEDDLTNVMFFAYLPNSNTILQSSAGVISGIPIGALTKVVAIAVNSSGDLFHFYQELTVNANVTSMVVMQGISDPQLTALLDSL